MKNNMNSEEELHTCVQCGEELRHYSLVMDITLRAANSKHYPTYLP